MSSARTDHHPIIIVYSKDILFTDSGFAIFRDEHIVRIEFVISGCRQIMFNALAYAIKRLLFRLNNGLAVEHMITASRFRLDHRGNSSILQGVKSDKHIRDKAYTIRKRMAMDNLTDKALSGLCVLVFAKLGRNLHESLEVHLFALKAFGQLSRVRRFHVVDDKATRSHVQVLVIFVIGIRRRHLNFSFLNVVLFQESRARFTNNPLAMVRDKTFLDVVCNLDFTCRIVQAPVQESIGFQGIVIGLDILCIGHLVAKIHVGKGICKLVTVLVVIEGKFIVGVHQAVHRIEALIHEREEVVFESLIVGRELFLQFRILLESDRIKSLAAEKGARGFSHLFRIRDDVPHTHHEGVVFLENRFAIHPGNESILVSNGIATRENQGAERTKHKQSFFHKVLMNMCA